MPEPRKCLTQSWHSMELRRLTFTVFARVDSEFLEKQTLSMLQTQASYDLNNRDSVRKAREAHLIDKAMTLDPHGINRPDELNDI